MTKYPLQLQQHNIQHQHGDNEQLKNKRKSNAKKICHSRKNIKENEYRALCGPKN